MARDESRPPFLLSFRSSKWLIAFTVFIATFTDGFVYGIIVPVLPFSLVDRSGVPPGQVHGISMMLASPVAGWLADRSSSRQLPFLAGLALIFFSAILFMVGTSPGLLVLARCLQGASAGVVFTVGLALLADTVGREEIGQWLGFVLSGMSIGVAVAPFIGGIVYAKLGYYAVFVLVLVVVAFDFLLRTMMIEKQKARQWTSKSSSIESSGYGTVSHSRAVVHQPGQVSSLDGSTDASGFDDDEPNGPNSERQSIKFSQRELQDKAGEAKTSLFARYFPSMAALVASPRLMSAAYGSFINTTLLCAFDSVLPFFVSRTFGWTSVGAGVIFLPITLPSFLAPIVGTLSDRYGPRVVVLSGFILTAPSVALLALIDGDGMLQTVLLCGLLCLAGLGSAAIYAPLAADMSAAVEDIAQENPDVFGEAGAYAQAYGLFDGAVAGGTVFGPAWAGLLYQKTNWAITMCTLAVIVISGTLPVMRHTGNQKRGKPGYQPISDSSGV